MDSLTQIVLGAACGEAVAGRKLGNRALLWGAVGGTIPDLDVFSAFFIDEIGSTSFHRGFMHSFLFAVISPWLFAWLAQRFHGSGTHQKSGYKVFFFAIWSLLYVGAASALNLIPFALGTGLSWAVLIPTLLVGILFIRTLWKNYLKRSLTNAEAPYLMWVNLFFWSIFTHPILDCFTNWGTQIWQPFADTRVQWCTVSVVDPLATVPFGICLFVLLFFAPQSRMRAALNWIGIAWFCGYLGYTYWHKTVVDTAFKQELTNRNIPFSRFYTNPSIFNNIVWYGVAETDTAYYFGMYGFKDQTPRFDRLSVLPKMHERLDGIPNTDRAKKFLLWFTEGYYNVLPYGNNADTMIVNDLRFGLLGDTLRGRNYVFPFLLFKKPDGTWDVLQNNRRNTDLEQNKRAMSELWERVTVGRK